MDDSESPKPHEHNYIPIKHGPIMARMCSCGKTDILETYEDMLDFQHERTYRWKMVEEPREEKRATEE